MHINVSGQVSGTPADHLPSIPQIVDFVTANPAAAAVIAVVALVVVVLAFLALRAVLRAAGRVVRGLYRTTAAGIRSWAKDRPAEEILTIVVASIATGVSAQGMWRFSGDVLGFDGPLRLLLFAFIEAAVITSAVRARRNMRENFTAGIDGVAVWVLAVLTAVFSAMDARSLAEAIFRLAAPLVAAWLWERGMAIERHRITGRSRINWRLTPERVLVYLGIAEASDRTAGEVDRQRRLTRVALAAKYARDLRAAGASARRQRRALKRLQRAYTSAAEHAGLARDADQQQALTAETAALYSADQLLDVTPAADWTAPAEPEPAPVPDPEFTRLADETARLAQILATKDDTRASLANLAMLAAAATGQHLSPVTASVTPPATGSEVAFEVAEMVTPQRVDRLEAGPAGMRSATAAATGDVTGSAVAAPVAEPVAFDVTNTDLFDLGRLAAEDFDVTAAVTRSAVANPVTTPVAEGVTDRGGDQRKDAEDVSADPAGSGGENNTDDDPSAASKTKIMRDFWDSEVSEDRYPSVMDLANHADAHHSMASRLRPIWVKELPWWKQRKAKAVSRRVQRVNGSRTRAHS